MRARMALKYAGINVQIHEVSLREKPISLLQISAKATVPVLQLADSTVIDQSLGIMRYALDIRDTDHWLNHLNASIKIIHINDGDFKRALDCYKYPERNMQKTQLAYRTEGEVFLQQLEDLLLEKPYLNSAKLTLADIAIFPFVRQFAAVDHAWFNGEGQTRAPYPKLHAWLQALIGSELFLSIMHK